MLTLEFLLAFIALPAAAAGLVLLTRKESFWFQSFILILAALLNLQYAAVLPGLDASLVIPWGGFDFSFALRVYDLSAYVLLAAAGFGVLVAVFSAGFMSGRQGVRQFYSYFLLTLSFVNGALLADDLVLLLFFWEGLLVLLFGMIYTGHAGAHRTAVKALVINGVTDLCMMVGVGLTIFIAHTSRMSQISGLPLDSGLANAAFLLLAVGAMSKGGAMPFHSWIPDASEDAPLPFMALVPAAIEKLLGIYFLARISLDLFQLKPGAWAGMVLMVVGALTILLAVLMALVQKDYKRLLSFHAVSQVGYMILGLGTAVPAGIVGGLFHMINHALYKCCLFLTAGAVEKQTGTSDLQQLGGLGRRMPLTCLGFIIAALSISGFPFTNGFFSKELIYEGALESGWVFYGAAVLGSLLTAASFLKLGHAAYFDRARSGRTVKEASLFMLLPILIIAALCMLFGLYNALPLGVIEEAVGAHTHGHHFAGMPKLNFLTWMTIGALAGALVSHLIGVRRSGSGLGAADHIHYAPGLHWIYDRAEMRYFDPYEIGMRLARILGRVSWAVDRGVDWIYNRAVPCAAQAAAAELSREHNGVVSRYLGWSLLGAVLALAIFVLV